MLVVHVCSAQIIEFKYGSYKGTIDIDGTIQTIEDTDLHEFADRWFVDIQKSKHTLKVYGFAQGTEEPVWEHSFLGDSSQTVTFIDGYKCTTWLCPSLQMCVVIYEAPRVNSKGKLRYVTEAVWMGTYDQGSRTILSNKTLENTD